MTPDEVKKLNQQVQIPLFLLYLGCDAKLITPYKNYTQYRFPCWWRSGDNPHGGGAFYEHSKGKWFISDFIHKSVINLDLLDFATKVIGKSFKEALDLLIFCSGKDNGFQYVNPLHQPNNSLSSELERPEPIDDSILGTFKSGLHPYWAERGFTPEIAKYYKLGWSTYGELKDRLTIPILDEKGRLVSVQGRTLNDRLEPKYTYLKGTGDSAKLVLYNYPSAKVHSKSRGWVGVHEGATDVWTAYKYGYYNFVGTLSTSVTDRQLELLMELKCNIVIFFDYDATETMSGQIAAVSLANKLKECGHKGIYIVNIGFHADPSDLTHDQYFMSLKNAVKYG